MSITITGLAIIQIFPEQILSFFKASNEMLLIGVPALRIISISLIFAGAVIILLYVFQALGHGILSLQLAVIRQLMVLLPVAYLLSRTGSVNAIWWAFPIAEVVAITCALIFMKKVYKKEIKNIKEDK